MDMNSLLGILTSPDAINHMGKASKMDSSVVSNVLGAALPNLLGGAKEQSQSKDTATSFAEALLSHGKKDTEDLNAFINSVDTEDGAKIVSHLLGGTDADQLDGISRAAGTSNANTLKILALAAPLLMSLLGKQSTQNASNQSASAINSVAGSLLQNVNLGSILTGMLISGAANNLTGNLTGNNQNQNQNNSGSGLLGLLGNLLK